MRTARTTRRILAIVLAISVSGLSPVGLFAQSSVSGVLVPGSTFVIGDGAGGFTLSATATPLEVLGPWSTVVKGVPEWGRLEDDAKATLATLHGIPNDARLPHAAADEIRALVMARLLDIGLRHSKGETVSAVDLAALLALESRITERRVAAAASALNEYDRWASSPCGYQPPANFGFAAYNPGPSCFAGPLSQVAGSIPPPTLAQFTAYGAALANAKYANADADAAIRRITPELAAVAAIGAAVAVSAVVAAAVGSSLAASTALVTLIGGFATQAAFSFAVVSGFSGFLATAPAILSTGAGAASVIGIPLVFAAVTITRIIQIVEESSIRPELTRQLHAAASLPNVGVMIQDPTSLAELQAMILAQTLPDYETERLNANPRPPTAPAATDPKFRVNGVDQQVLRTTSPDDELQETFMSRGWFVTRTRNETTGQFSPWRWSLKLKFKTADGSVRFAGVQPNSFLLIDPSTTQALSTASFLALIDGVTKTVALEGHAPTLFPTLSGRALPGQAVTINAGASDPENNIAGVIWYVQDPTYHLDEDTDPFFGHCLQFRLLGQTPNLCPWRQYGGPSIQVTWADPGTYGVIAHVKNGEGLVTTRRFSVTVGAGLPTLGVNPVSATSIVEGQSVTVSGTVDLAQLPGGGYNRTVSLVVDWGDNTVTRQDYPCSIDPLLLTGSGSELLAVPPTPCTMIFNESSEIARLQGGPAGPWPFAFSHTYAFGPTRATPAAPVIRVHAVNLRDNLSTFSTEFNINVANVPPQLTLLNSCPLDAGPLACQSPLGYSRLEVPSGAPAKIRMVIDDVPTATHAVRVLWGDGTSTSALSPPGQAKIVELEHRYSAAGTKQIQVEVDDGGPGGLVTRNTTASVFAFDVQGPTAVEPGDPATYTVSWSLPVGVQVAFQPDCGFGTVTGRTGLNFTCVFPESLALPTLFGPMVTTTSVGVHATVAGVTVDRGLSINVNLYKPPSVSNLTGPTAVFAGVSAGYTYARGGSWLFTPADVVDCNGQPAVAAAPGTFTCVFPTKPTAYTARVRVTLIDTRLAVVPRNAVAELSVNVKSDLTPPAITISLPSDGATYFRNQKVRANYSCNDGTGSGVASCVGTIPSGAAIDTSVLGRKTFSVTATDLAGNTKTVTRTYIVGYSFSALAQLVKAILAFLATTAGQSIRIQFQLLDLGVPVTDLAAVSGITYQSMSCTSLSSATGQLQSAATGGSSLRFDAPTRSFVFDWKTPKAPGCYALSVNLRTGQQIPSYFWLK